jgi:UDP-N-acetylmuramate: L-alanyl-gamma-D-glutamyl-meso-diaminopimelate ligase
MHIHILGICGTFMGGIALIARQLGHKVTGSDQNVYPPMSTQLEEQGIELCQGYQAEDLKQLQPDLVVIGNALSRGNAAVEYVLDNRVPYTSGPEWLARYALHDKWVLAASGTHGKTSTSSMLAWILQDANLNPGFLIGGVPENFGLSARITESPFFVVEADEYDTAFFDKRSKFVHYHPRTLIINNLEFDHADIFSDLAAIQTQFHHLVRTVPGNGLIIHPNKVPAIEQLLDKGCWTDCEIYNGSSDDLNAWRFNLLKADCSEFEVFEPNSSEALVVNWSLIGEHNLFNGIAAIAAARHAGVPAKVAVEGLAKFNNVKRRMELKGVVNQVSVYDDFAHHPTAIATTLAGLRAKVGDERIIAITDLRSNTMRAGVHKNTLIPALEKADINLIHMPQEADWQLHNQSDNTHVFSSSDQILKWLEPVAKPHDHLLVMSNGGFDGIHQKLLQQLAD